jgi:hypothetical protein
MPFMSDRNSAMSLADSTADKFFRQANEFEGLSSAASRWSGRTRSYTTKKAIPRSTTSRPEDPRGGGVTRRSSGARRDVALAPAPQTYDVLSRRRRRRALPASRSASGDERREHGIHVPGGFNQAVQALIINEAKWKALSPADQAAIEKLLGEHWSLLWGNLWDKTNAAAIEQMKIRDVRDSFYGMRKVY